MENNKFNDERIYELNELIRKEMKKEIKEKNKNINIYDLGIAGSAAGLLCLGSINSREVQIETIASSFGIICASVGILSYGMYKLIKTNKQDNISKYINEIHEYALIENEEYDRKHSQQYTKKIFSGKNKNM